MKKIFILSMFISVTMICSCNKQDSAAERQLAQRKAELDAREQSLDERMNELNERVNALDERVSALAEEEKARMNARGILPGVQGQIPNDAQVKAEMDSTQLSADDQSLMPDPSQLAAEKAEKDRITQERHAQSQGKVEDVQSRRQRKVEQAQRWRRSGAAGSPATDATSLNPSPAPQ